MATLYDFLPKQDESGCPIYRTYWAVGKYRKSEKERPWLEFLVDPDGQHCYPISHEKPWEKGDFFHISRSHEDFGLTNLSKDTDSWVEASCPCVLPSGVDMRRRGVMTGKLAAEFKKWLDGLPRGRRANPPLGELLQNEEIFIAPWIYTELGFDAVTFFECAAIEAYQSATRSSKIPANTCFYDGARDILVRPSKGTPDITWWTRAYMDYTWVRLLHRDIKAEWRGLIAKRSNAGAAASLMDLYILHVRHYRGREEFSMETFSRATLAEAAVGVLLDPGRVGSAELRRFANEYCWPFFVKKRFGAH